MFNRFYKHTAAASLAVCLAASLSAPSSAACYLGECTTVATTSTAPSMNGSRVSLTPPPGSEQPVRIVATHGSWRAAVKGGMALIADKFEDGSLFVVKPYYNGSFSFMLSDPKWHLKPGQKFDVKADIDGHIFSGTGDAYDEHIIEIANIEKEALKAFYRGQTAKITIQGEVFNMTTLVDAALMMDVVKTYLKSASL